jgi:hypothetical protein
MQSLRFDRFDLEKGYGRTGGYETGICTGLLAYLYLIYTEFLKKNLQLYFTC